MIRIQRSKLQPIGVDIGTDSVRMLQLEATGTSLAVVAAARQALPAETVDDPRRSSAAAIECVRQMLRHNPFVGRRVVVALPRTLVHVKNLRLPPMPAAEIQSAVEFEARNIFPFDVDTATVQALSAGEVRQGNEVRQELIVVAARHDDVNEFVEAFHQSGTLLESIDFEPAAIYRSVERFIRRREDEQEVHVLVDIGSRRSEVIIGRGRDISFVKPIDLGGRNFHEAVARKLGITSEEAKALRRRLIESSDAEPTAKRDPVRQAVADATRSVMEELAREISLCLRYYAVTFRGQRPGKVRLVGGEAFDPQLQSILGATLTVPVEPGRPLANVDTSRMKSTERRGTLSDWAVAFGLGLKATSGSFAGHDKTPRAVQPATLAPAVEMVTEGGDA